MLHAARFRPRMLAFIVPQATRLPPGYRVLLNDIELLKGFAFYLPNSFDTARRTRVMDWNHTPPAFYILVREDWHFRWPYSGAIPGAAGAAGVLGAIGTLGGTMGGMVLGGAGGSAVGGFGGGGQQQRVGPMGAGWCADCPLACSRCSLVHRPRVLQHFSTQHPTPPPRPLAGKAPAGSAPRAAPWGTKASSASPATPRGTPPPPLRSPPLPQGCCSAPAAPGPRSRE